MMEVQEPNSHSEQNKMLPPPVGTFQSREELLKHVRYFALTQGYMVSIKDSSKDRYVTISCDRGGIYRKRLKTGENMRKRKAPSRLTNCPFEVVAKKDDELWSLTVKHGEHNHEPSHDITDHPSCRWFTDEEVVIIREMTAAGKRPRHILKVLRQKNPTLVSDSRNVYNVKAKIRREILSGKSMESPPTSSAGTATSGQEEPNGVAMADSTTGYLQTNAVKETKALLSELCHHFYTLGWLLGTGGSITIKAHVDFIPKPRQLIVMSASGVQKERMSPEDMYVLSSDGYILLTPPLKPFPHKPPQCSDCAPLFLKVYELRNAGAVIHSHGMEACLVTMIHPLSQELRITHMEMIKGIEGHGYHDELVVPIIKNAAHERDLTESLTEAITAYPKTTAVLVRNHGVYIWGDSWISAKTQAECYHYLFDAAIKLHQLGLDSSTPGHGPIRNNGVCGYGNMSRTLKTGPLGLDYVIQPSQRCILLGVEGTTTAKSFLTKILLPYAADNIQFDVEQGVVGAVPVAPDYMGKDKVIASLAANVEAMIKTDRKPPSLKQLQGRIWRNGFEGNELVGVVFDDVPEALERWHSSGIKVYVYSSSTREAQHIVLGNSNYGDLRKYLCGFFDTSVGSKSEARSYVEICQTVGVDKRSDMLFITDAFQEAEAARAEGLEVIISVRPGNERLPENHGFRTIESLMEL